MRRCLVLQVQNESSFQSMKTSASRAVTVTAVAEDGTEKKFEVLVRFDSEIEIDYYRHGGILPMVLREKLQETTSAE